MIILGIESSCDETSASIINENGQIKSNIISSQIDTHSKYGGVVPELASRKHLENIRYVIDTALNDAAVALDQIDLISVTKGPGLVGALLVGLSTAKAIAYACKKPLIGVNHLEGHILSVLLSNPEITFPFIAIIVSGGHTDIYYVKNFCSYEILGRTLDDAVGESFDKVAKMMGLDYPGGPIIEKKAGTGNNNAIKFPRAYLSKDSLDFSFSGLKTSVKNYILKNPEYDSNDVSASFQQAVFDVITSKIKKAVKSKNVKTAVAVGGVACNNSLRKELSNCMNEIGIRTYFPAHILCTDNAAMIAFAGYQRFKIKDFSSNDLLPLDANTSMGLSS